MVIIRDAIVRLRVGKIAASSPVEAIFLTDGRSSLVVGTAAYGKGVDPAAIPEADKVALARQALFVGHELAESQKPER